MAARNAPPAISLDSPLEAVLGGHEGAVLCVGISPDGNLVASGGVDATARIWDRLSGEPIDRLIAGTGQPNRDNKTAVVDESHGIVRDLSFSPAGDKLAAAVSNGDLVVWDVAEGRELYRSRDPECKRYAVAFSGDGRTIAVGDNLGLVSIVDAQSGEQLRTIGDSERAGRRRHMPDTSRSGASAATVTRKVAMYNSFDDVPPMTDRSTHLVGPLDQAEFFAQQMVGLEDCVAAIASAPTDRGSPAPAGMSTCGSGNLAQAS